MRRNRTKPTRAVSPTAMIDWRPEMDAYLAAMTDADWQIIETIVEALRERYPGLHIEYGPW